MSKRVIILAILIFGIFTGMHTQIKGYVPDNNIDSYNADKELKFIIVGDPHVNASNISNGGDKRLEQVVDFVNNRSDVDFVTFMGDMTDDGSEESNNLVEDILKKLNKRYYVLAGNHDIKISPKIFESYYGSAERIEYINGYQLLFIGIYEEKEDDRIKLRWSFDFSNVNKDVPTLVFIHGPVKDLPIGCIHCMVNRDMMEYAKDIESELSKFTNLIGVYSGHIHYDSDQIIDGVRYVTINGLANINLGKITVVGTSNKVGYSVIKDNRSYYELIPYV